MSGIRGVSCDVPSLRPASDAVTVSVSLARCHLNDGSWRPPSHNHAKAWCVRSRSGPAQFPSALAPCQSSEACVSCVLARHAAHPASPCRGSRTAGCGSTSCEPGSRDSHQLSSLGFEAGDCAVHPTLLAGTGSCCSRDEGAAVRVCPLPGVSDRGCTFRPWSEWAASLTARLRHGGRKT